MTQIVLTPQEIEDFRSQLADHPEALAALDKIADQKGDLEYATQLLALEEGVEKNRGESWLESLSQRCRNIVCQDEFRNDLLAGVVTALVAYIAASGNLPGALATPVAVYIVKIGVKSFCNATEVNPKIP